MVFENLFRIIDFHLWFDFLIFSTETEWRPWCNTWCLLWANMCVFVQACVFVCKRVCFCAQACVFVCKHVCFCVQACVFVCKHVCLCTSMCACVQALGKNDSYICIDFSKQGIMLVRVCLKSFAIYWIKRWFFEMPATRWCLWCKKCVFGETIGILLQMFVPKDMQQSVNLWFIYA